MLARRVTTSRGTPVSDESLYVTHWLHKMGSQTAQQVDRLWPEENNPAFRGAALAEEVGEVNRAITKRRHAENSPNGTCKGMTVEDWNKELEKELGQAFCVILDIAYREHIDLAAAAHRSLHQLEKREIDS